MLDNPSVGFTSRRGRRLISTAASTDECARIQRYPGFVLESDAVFYVALPDLVTGSAGFFPASSTATFSSVPSIVYGTGGPTPTIASRPACRSAPR